MNPIGEFLERCDAIANQRSWKRSTLSTLLFQDGKRLDQLAGGNSDVGVLRLEAAKAALGRLETETKDGAA
jgi:hypothetical protein